MTPSIAIAIPLYFWFNKLGLLNTKVGVILAHFTFTLAFVVYLMREFFNDIPKELDESALSDGCSELQAFTKIVVPIAKPGLIATFFITYMYSWNEMLIAMIIGGEAGRTLPAAFPGFVTPLGTLWGQLCAASFVVTLPIVVIMIVLQKHIVRGLTMGALK
jgi:multiple sugar transport system permease protein